MKTLRLSVTIVLAALALTACGTGVPSEPVSAPSPTKTPYSFVDPNIPNADYGTDDSPSALDSDYSSDTLPIGVQESILESIWNERGPVAAEQICEGWRRDSSAMLDIFMSQASETFDRAVAREFFNGKC